MSARPHNCITEASPTTWTQRRVERFPNESLRQAPQMHHMADEFEHLLRWQDTAEDDEIVDFAMEDDSLGDEEHTDWADITPDEDDLDVPLDSSEREDMPCRIKLTKEEIADIVSECINIYIDAWRPNADVLEGQEVNYDVNKMWDEAEASGRRQALVEKHEKDHKYYSHRLDTLCEEIVQFPGSNANQIRRQCRNLEATVHSMELAGWLRDIYKLEPIADSDDELASHSDNAFRDASLPKSQAVAGIDVIDVDSLSKPTEYEEWASSLDRPIQDVAHNSGFSMNRQRQTLTSRPVIADSVEVIVGNNHGAHMSSRILSNYGDQPENASISSVRRWKWHELIEHLDRKRVVSKTIFGMNVNDRESVRTRIRLMKKTSLLREIAACVNMLRKGETKLPGILPQDMRKIIGFTNLFLSWWFCKNYFEEPHASIGDLEELKCCLDDGSAGTSTFYDYLCTIMQTTFSEQALQHPEKPSQIEIIEISDDDS